jgi:hemolysin III
MMRGWSHVIMFFVALIACSILIGESDSALEKIATSIYSTGVLILFGVSSIYHRVFWNNPVTRQYVGRLDHSAIYIMIAGGFTPICLLVLPDTAGYRLLLLIWVVTVVGILKSLFFTIPKWVSSLFYMLMGFLVLPYFSMLMELLDTQMMVLLIAGGVAYCVGAICYALKRPQLIQHVFGYHEVFHMLVNIGAILHYFMVYSIIKR